MSSPYSAGRDSNAAAGNAFDVEADVSDSHLSAFRDSFIPPSDQLSEQDYRDSVFGGGGTDDVRPMHDSSEYPQRFTYPEPLPGGGRFPS